MERSIYIVRHGETDYNKRGIVQGRGIDSALNAEGRAQAQRFFQHYKNTGFRKIYVSTLRRTFETISPFTALDIPVERRPGLDEIDWGSHEGQTNGDSFRRFYDIVHQWKNGHYTAKIKGGESPLDVAERMKPFIAELESDPADPVLICTHGRAMRILLCILLERPLSEMDLFPHLNLSLYRLTNSAGMYSITLFNNTLHLHDT